MDDYMKCICCNEEKEILISVEKKSQSIFLHRRGVCQDCLKNKDINKVCEEFELRETKTKIKEQEGFLEDLKDELKRLEK